MKLNINNKSHIQSYDSFGVMHIDVILDAKAFNLLIVYRKK